MSGRGSRYLAGLSVAAVGLVAGGWLALTPYAFAFHDRERLTAWATGAGLAVLSAVSLGCWTALWRRRLRADRVLGPAGSRRWRRSRRRQARAERLVKATRRRELSVAPDPAQVLTDLRELLTPLLTDHSLVADRVVVQSPPPSPLVSAPSPPPAGCDNQPVMGGWLSQPAAVAAPDAAVNADAAEASHTVQAPGQVRGPRSASFLAAPTKELLVVGSGEEESW